MNLPFSSRDGHSPSAHRPLIAWIAAWAVWGSGVISPNHTSAQEAPNKSEQRELWVPTEHLETVLASRPRAVVLTPEQYRTLVRDAVNGTAEPEPEVIPPVAATITEATLGGILGDEVVAMTARYRVICFSEGWQEIPLHLPLDRLGQVTVDDQSALRILPAAKGKKGGARPVLALRGRGEHSVQIRYHVPVTRTPAGNSIQIPSPGVASSQLRLQHRPGVRFSGELPFRSLPSGEGLDGDPLHTETTEFVLPSDTNEPVQIEWTARTIAAIPEAAVFQTCQYLYSIDSTRLQADLGLVLSSSLSDLPREYSIGVPEGVRVLSISGSELLRWTRNQENGNLEIVLVSGKRRTADLRILAEADVPDPDSDDADIQVTLPIARIDGVHRASGTIAILGSDDVRVKNIATGPLTVVAPEAIDPTLVNLPEFVTGFRFPVTTEPPEVTLSPLRDRFNAQLDTRIELRREAVHLTRQLELTVLEGRLFTTEIVLPEGEELVSIEPAIDSAASSDFVGAPLEGNRIRLSWQSGLSVGETASLTLSSRRDPPDWFTLGETPLALAFENAQLAEAEAVSGYVATAFDDSFRVETANATNLEPRDGRTTPVTGTLAWFRLSDYELELNVSRRATEIEAALTAYALPLQSTLEIEGQLDLDIRYTPISEIVVGLDPEIAEQLRFDSPLLAEKRLDEDTGEWTLAFHDEQIGFRRLRFRMALPFEMEAADSDPEGPRHFSVEAPVLNLPAAKRLRGDWIIEANTDTELTFEPTGLDAIDSLRVPQVAGYQPRHRVIAAFQFRGDQWNLDITGTRHLAEELVTTVVDSLVIDTVISTDGDDRHQAILQLRTSGEQFLEVGLPESAQVWTLTVDGTAVKPVRADPGTLRVQLPAREVTDTSPITLKFLYQTPGERWRGSGRESLDPIRIPGRIPITRSEWRLHLPDGYDYQAFRSNLQETFQVVDRTLLGQAWRERDRFLPDLPPLSESAIAYGGVRFDSIDADSEMTKEEAVQTTSQSARFEMFKSPRGALPVPSSAAPGGFGDSSGVEARLRSIIVPNVEFEDMPLRDALAYLEEQARRADPTGEGVDIESLVPIGSGSENMPGFEGTAAPLGDTQITLKLSNVPLSEALRYTTALANLKYQVTATGVNVLPISTPDSELVTREFLVPPDFLAQATQPTADGGMMADPFAAAPADSPDSPFDSNAPAAVQARQSARNVLESYGITFPAGSTATYNPETGRLIVRNTTDQMELVESLNSSLSVSDGDEMPQQMNGDIPVLGDLPATGALFVNGAVSESPLQGLSVLVDSESGERLVIGSDNPVDQESGAALEGFTGIGGGGGALTNDYVIDQLDLRGLSLADAVSQLDSKIRELSTAQPTAGQQAAGRPVQLALDADSETAGKPVSFELRNVTLGDALARLTAETNTEFRTTASGIVIAQPSPIPLDQLTTLVLELPNSAFEKADGNGTPQRQSARLLLTGAGIDFPPGTSAAYNFSTGRLAVRNTPDALDQVRAVFSDYIDDYTIDLNLTPEVVEFNGYINYGGVQLKGFDPGNAGLIPIDFVLPESGRSYVFTGLYAPESLRFRYVNWERQVRLAWIWMLVGGVAFWVGAYRKLGRPIFVGFLGIVVLSFVPLVFSKSLLSFCNSLLIGWLAAALLWVLFRLCQAVSSRDTTSSASDGGLPSSAKPTSVPS